MSEDKSFGEEIEGAMEEVGEFFGAFLKGLLEIIDQVLDDAIEQLAHELFEGDTFERILAAVFRWEDKGSTQGIGGADKRNGVLEELQTIGLDLTEHMARTGIQLAVTKMKNMALN